MNRRTRSVHGERARGAVLVFFALLLVGMLAVGAMVIDLGALRARAGKNQSIADLAALAAGDKLSVGDYTGACRDAVTYLKANAPALAALSADAMCAQPGNDVSKTMCTTPAGVAQVRPSQTVANYTVTIHFPVPDSELADSRSGPGIDDGSPCERMRVVVSSTEATYFGGVVGKESFTATRSAVVRGGTDPRTRIPALWLLDPVGCTSLAVSGGSRVSVGSTSPEVVAGVVMIDSDGSACSSNQYTITSSGAGTRLAALPSSGEPKGNISLHALRPGATSCVAPACDPADVSGGRLSPQPIGTGDRATRAAVDWRYNCKDSYPAYHGVAIEGCESDTPAYLDRLVDKIGSSGSPGRTTETGSTAYQRWTSTYPCNPTGAVVATGNWWVDCPAGFSIGNGTDVTFTDGNVVFDGGLSMTGGSFTVNSANNRIFPSSCLPPDVTTPCTGTSSAASSFVYVRNGAWNITGGTIDVNHSFVYLVNGYLKVASSAPSWSAPDVGPFTGMALWAGAASNKFQINGGAGVDLTGIFFTPEAAPMSLSGGGDWGQLHAQFVSYHLTVSGGGVLNMSPDPRSVALPPRDRQLIR
jgi:Flp pilus assembly protein TadG